MDVDMKESEPKVTTFDANQHIQITDGATANHLFKEKSRMWPYNAFSSAQNCCVFHERLDYMLYERASGTSGWITDYCEESGVDQQ